MSNDDTPSACTTVSSSMQLLPPHCLHLVPHGSLSWLQSFRWACSYEGSPQSRDPSGNLHALLCRVLHGLQHGYLLSHAPLYTGCREISAVPEIDLQQLSHSPLLSPWCSQGYFLCFFLTSHYWLISSYTPFPRGTASMAEELGCVLQQVCWNQLYPAQGSPLLTEATLPASQHPI